MRSLRLAFGFALVLASGPSWAGAQNIPVRIGGETSSLLGVPFDVPIEVDLTGRAERLGSFALTLRWNPAVLRFVGGKNGNFGEITANEDSLVAGVAKLAGVNPGGVGGKVVLGVARFVPLSASNDTFRLQVSELYAAGSFADLLPDAVWSDRAYCPAAGRFGDIDSDNGSNSRDALLALSYSVGLAIAGNPALGDVDGDGLTGARDALIMLSNAVGLDVSVFRIMRIAPGPCAAPKRPILAVLPGTLTMDVGQQASLVAVASDSTGAGMAVTDVFWRSSDEGVVSVAPEGRITAVGPGTATVTAVRQSGTSASAAVTVLDRRTHWVDAFAIAEASANRIGAPELPFATIQEALNYADPNDTIMVRSGRYQELIVVYRPAVIMGDTSGGRPRPVIASPGGDTTAFWISARGRVELHRIQVDTARAPVYASRVDTLVVREARFRHPASAFFASITVDTADLVVIQNSGFFGSPGLTYAGNALSVNRARVVVVDSSVISDYGADGIHLNSVDSLFLRGSIIRNNYGYGIFSCPDCFGAPAMAAVFSGNRFFQNNSGHLYLDEVRLAAFNRNVFVGEGYDGINLYGLRDTTVVRFVGDSIDTRYGNWLNLYGFDSLTVDSSTVVVNDGYSDIESGGDVAVRNSRFLNVLGTALDLDAGPDSMHLLLRKVEFRGVDSVFCTRCGTGIEGYGDLSVDGDSVTLVNFYEAMYLDYAWVDLRNSVLRDYDYGIEVDCYSVKVDNVTFERGGYGIYLYGCNPTDSLVVKNSAFRRQEGTAIYDNNVRAVITNSVFESNYEAVEHDCFSLDVDSVQISAVEYSGIQAYGCSSSDSLIIRNSSLTGGPTGYLGVEGDGMGYNEVSNSILADWDYAIELDYGSVVVADNRIDRPRYSGIDFDVNDTLQAEVLRNAISCDGFGARNAWAIQGYDARMLIRDNSVSGCYAGIYTVNSATALPRGTLIEIRNNSIALPDTGLVGIQSEGPKDWAKVVGNTVSGKARYGSIAVGYFSSSPSAPRAEVDSNTVTGSIEAGVLGQYVDSLWIRDNVFSGLDPAGCCLSSRSAAIVLEYSAGSNALAQILRNRISDSRASGIVLDRNFGDTVTVLVDSNTVRRADSIGIWVNGYSRANIRKNAIDSVGLDAVLLSQFGGVPGALVNENNFSRSRRYAVNNTNSQIVINAENNWWNDPNGPSGFYGDTTGTSTGDSVSNYVDWDPWSTAPIGTLSPAPPMIAALPPARVVAAAAAATGVREPSSGRRIRSAPRSAYQPRRPALAFSFREPVLLPYPPGTPEELITAQRVQAERLQQRLAERKQRLEERERIRAERDSERQRRLELRRLRYEQMEAARAAERAVQMRERIP
ncbi:MAG: hypothetical protein KatS3mg081_1193 [Gemmatimonadales bacterium]|nr:MAG: hypothetical protein KatS3mg081_1193 [Gemmatimonadales bacterium]